MESIKEPERPKFSIGHRIAKITTNNNRYSNKESEELLNESTLKFAKSMNFPIFSTMVKKPKIEKVKDIPPYKIPDGEYIWNAPYLKKAQIFPSYVRKKIKYN